MAIIAAGLVFFLHCGTPCNTFTAARKLDGGPPPLRSKEAPEGLPGLRPSDEVLVFLGNLFLERSAEACFLVFALGGDFTVENPLLSLIWDTAQMQQLLAGARAFALDFDQCAFGTPWLKPTDAAGQLHRSFGFSVRALLGRPCSRKTAGQSVGPPTAEDGVSHQGGSDLPLEPVRYIGSADRAALCGPLCRFGSFVWSEGSCT